MVPNKIQFLMPSGLVIPGDESSKVFHYIFPEISFIHPVLSWNWLVGKSTGLFVSTKQLREQIRSTFSWRKLLSLAATFLGAVRSGPVNSRYFNAKIATLSLCDNWPASIVNFEQYIQEAERLNQSIITVSPQGLLCIIADALAHPWDSADSSSDELFLERRFARIAMVASGADEGRFLVDERTGTLTSRQLLGVASLTEEDGIDQWITRSHALYVELLEKYFPSADEAFHKARGMSVGRWTLLAATLHGRCKSWIKDRQAGTPLLVFDDRSNEETELCSAARMLSYSREEFVDQFKSLSTVNPDPTLAFLPIRKRPLLRLSEKEYLVLHNDFLLASMDDGVMASMRDSLSKDSGEKFNVAFGDAFEEYVFEILTRAATREEDSQVVRVPTAKNKKKAGGKRCDFAWRIGSDVILIDAKKIGLSANALMGDPSAQKKHIEMAERGVRQLLQAAQAIDDGDQTVLSALKKERGWRPSRLFGAIIHHRPLYIWLGDSENITKSIDHDKKWKKHFAGWPAFWSLSDAEVLERGLKMRPIADVLDSIAGGTYRVNITLKSFFQGVLPSEDDFYMKKAKSILSSNKLSPYAGQASVEVTLSIRLQTRLSDKKQRPAPSRERPGQCGWGRRSVVGV